MRELAQAAASFSWSLSLFGLQQAANLIRRPDIRQSGHEATTGFDSLASATEGELQDWLKDAFMAGNQLQRELTQSLFHYLSLDSLRPSSALQISNDLMRDSLSTARFYFPQPQSAAAWRELINKVRVFRLVKDVQTKLRVPREGHFSLSEYVDKSYALGPYPALWAVEGLGHDYADSVAERGGEWKGLLKGDAIKGIPAGSLLMLHAGIGLSFAQHLLHGKSTGTPETEIQKALQEFVRLCKANSEPGYEGAALESLGLVSRTFHPDLVPLIDRLVGKIDSECLGYFWHGIGRAVYFLVVNFLPYGDPIWRAVEMGRREAPHQVGRQNALAGTSWAVTLVNMKNPDIMASLLENHGEELSQNPAFANGVTSSVVMRYDTSPDDRFVNAFRRYQPGGATNQLWNELIASSVEDAVDHFHEPLKKNHRLDQVFRCQDLAGLVGQLTA